MTRTVLLTVVCYITDNENISELECAAEYSLLENVEHCGGEPEQADEGILCHR